MPSKKNQQDYCSFYPSEPSTIAHFNVRHPVSGLEDTPFNIQKKKKENYLAFGFDKYARSFGAVLGVNIVFRS